MEVRSPDGRLLGEAPLGNRKDIRNAVEAARKAERMGQSHGAQSRPGSLLLRGEPGAAPRARLSIDWRMAVGEKQAAAEVELGIERIFSYAAWADKFDGAVHNPPFRNIAIAMNEADWDRRRHLPDGGASARIPIARDAAARHGQHGDCGSFGEDTRSLPAISINCSTPAICRAAR